MVKTAQSIAADLDELASALEAEASEYRRTAETLRRRSQSPGISTASEQDGDAPKRRASDRDAGGARLGDSQRQLLDAYRTAPFEGFTIDEVLDAVAAAQGQRPSKPAAQGANSRLLKKGAIERVGRGRYRPTREQAPSEGLERVSVLLPIQEGASGK